MEAFASDMFSLLQDSCSSDLTLVCPDGEVQVHRLMMSARSTVFSRLLNSDMEESSSGIVKIGDFKIDVVKAMVQYIYTAKIDDTFEDILNLMIIGDKYLIQSLVDDCGTKLSDSLSESNVLGLGAAAEVYSVQTLLDSCAQFVAENLDVLESDWKEELKNSPKFLMRILELLKIALSKLPEVSRFGSVDWRWECKGVRTDAISVKISCDATLTSIGLYGANTICSIPVKIVIRNDLTSSVVLDVNRSFKSTGSKEPIKLPVRVKKMSADNKYTIMVVINAGKEGEGGTFYGKGGKSEVICDETLKVNIEKSGDSNNYTNVNQGQIPT